MAFSVTFLQNIYDYIIINFWTVVRWCPLKSFLPLSLKHRESVTGLQLKWLSWSNQKRLVVSLQVQLQGFWVVFFSTQCILKYYLCSCGEWSYITVYYSKTKLLSMRPSFRKLIHIFHSHMTRLTVFVLL